MIIVILSQKKRFELGYKFELLKTLQATHLNHPIQTSEYKLVNFHVSSLQYKTWG